MRLNNKPCPRCACFLIDHFRCGCGAVESDYCVNCGRFTTADGLTELTELDAKCEKGRVEHEHPSEEKTERINVYFEKHRGA